MIATVRLDDALENKLNSLADYYEFQNFDGTLNDNHSTYYFTHR